MAVVAHSSSFASTLEAKPLSASLYHRLASSLKREAFSIKKTRKMGCKCGGTRGIETDARRANYFF